MLKRRLLLAVGIAGFVALVGGVVYLAVSSSLSRSVTPPAAPGLGFQPLPTPPGPARAAPRIGAQAPPFEARRLDAGTLGLADMRGQGVVMNFFASWCVPCRAEARDLEATYQKYKAQGIVFLGVDIEQDTWDDARAFIKEFGITYPAIRDETGKIAQRYQMFGLPTTYFIDKDGILRSKYVGPFLGPEGLKELERRIKTILP